VCRAPHAAQLAPIAALPLEILARDRAITLTANLMFVNSIPFLITFSLNVRFGTVEKL